MKVLLLNDTRSAGHVGCELVVGNTLDQCRRTGLEVVGAVTTAECREDVFPLLDDVAFDLLLVNGEGTMHHDRPVPERICQAARSAAQRGRKVVLYNTSWKEMDALNTYLDAFDLIFCRDSASCGAITSLGYVAETVPDMIFDSSWIYELAPADEHSVTIIDSIVRKTSETLARTALKGSFPFLCMDRTGYQRIRKRWLLRRAVEAQTPGRSYVQSFAESLAYSETVISGRFHGTCIALMLGKPVASVRSNTDKLETLYTDIGLEPGDVIREAGKDLISRAWIAFNGARARQDRIDAFTSAARGRIASMFDRIAGL